ncbi:hypothetical protein QUF84_26110 [Fictibacillus enclensis]|nr:hypothetical protein [Fictibacillus enclensis]MDM5340667.1 hypothetical protein [Fictibacillus enclensis]WHY72091.1 hypothetical protein QNH15_24395 [Fictibacillus enclensis]
MKKAYTYYNTGPEDVITQYLPISIVVCLVLFTVFIIRFFIKFSRK